MDQYDVAVIGFGPTGATAANLLGRYGLQVLVLERDLDVYPRQRAIAADEDALRVWQSLGLLPELLAGMETDIKVHFRHGRRVFLSFDAKADKGNGVPGTVFFHQPSLEATLRRGVTRYPHVHLRTGAELVGLEQGVDGVTLDVRTPDGAVGQARARYVLAADGGSSPVRKMLGIPLGGRQIDEQWFDIQVKARYDREPGSPLDFTFIADPSRPGVDCPCPGGYHRYEFQIMPGEDVAEIATEAGMRRVLAERGVDLDDLEVYRHWAYTFHVRQAAAWQQGRVLLAGDAAHIMPPFAGQGVSSGVRDAANLCWKLAAVLRGDAPEDLLGTYEPERRPNVLRHTAVSLRIGGIVMSRRRSVVVLRDALGLLVMRTPGLGDVVRRHPLKPAWLLGRSGALTPSRRGRGPAGRLVKQPALVDRNGARVPLDVLLGDGWAWVGVAGRDVPEAVRALDVAVVRVAPQGSDWSGLPDGVWADLDGLLHRQLRRYRAHGFLVRPDRFVYGSDRDVLSDPVGCPRRRLAVHR